MAFVCGVDVGGTKVLARTIRDGLAGEQVKVSTPRGGDAIAEAIAGAVEAASAGEALDAVGVGIPGLVNRSGVLRVGPNLPGVAEYPFGETLRHRLGVPVNIDNDANCALWGEFKIGAARGAADAVLVTLGTGIGGAIVASGALQRGANGFAGEPGHMVVDPSGPFCPCGRRGCWERFASGSGLARLGREAALAGRADRAVSLAGGDAEGVRGEHITTAAREGDADAIEVVRRFAWWVALGVANLVDLLDPDVVVVGGGLVEAADLLLEPVREHFGGLVVAADHRPAVPIVVAELGESAGAIGAGLLAAELV